MRRINIDLDGVLADFDGHYKTVTGVSFKSIKDARERWELLIGKEDDFYLNMPVANGGLELLWEIERLCERKQIEIGVLSALPSIIPFPTAKEQKLQWVKDKLGFSGYTMDFVEFAKSSRSKQRFAQPGHILIDDNPRNVAQWMYRGGIAVRHLHMSDTVAQLQELLP